MSKPPSRVFGRYVLHGEMAKGGMAAIHYGRLIGPAGFSRTVAIKRLHDHLAQDKEFSEMFLDEARLAARVRHPNVVSTLDVILSDGELLIVMDYVPGDSLSNCMYGVFDHRASLKIAGAIMHGVLQGLHAAHEAKNERGEPLGLVHRDVSPQNVLVGVDGVPRVVDFGIAKAAGRVHTTRDGKIKGKLAYMAPEQLRGEIVDRRVDVYAAGVVMWELLTGRRLFGGGDSEGAVVTRVLQGTVEPPSAIVADVPKAIDTLVMRALARDPLRRFDTAREMAIAIEESIALATATQIGEWVESAVGEVVSERNALVAAIEREASDPPREGDSTPDQTQHKSVSATAGAIEVVAPRDAASAATPHSPNEQRSQIAPARRRSKTPVLAACAVVAAACVAFAAFAHEKKKPVDFTAVSPPPASVDAPVSADLLSTAAPPSTGVASTPSLSSSASATTANSSRRSTPRAAGVSRSPSHSSEPIAPTRPATTASAAPNCTPPYFDDETGRHFIRECLAGKP